MPQNNKVFGSISSVDSRGLHLPGRIASNRVTKRFSSGQGIVRCLKTMKRSLHKKAWNPDIDGLESSDGNWTASDSE